MNINSQCVYLGDDWLMYAGPRGYDLSEMLAPGIILSQPDSTIICETREGERVEAPGLLHAGNAWSKAEADGLLVIYFDPLSVAGRALNQALAGRSIAPLSSSDPAWTMQMLEALCARSLSASQANAWVESCVDFYLEIDTVSAIDERLLKVAPILNSPDGGRVQLPKLAELVNVSAVHLRQLFKKQVSTTLSKYKAWRQFIYFIRCCELVEDLGSETSSHSWRIGNTIRDAGYYDDAHGLRTLSRYFGPRSSLKDVELFYLNCTSAAQGH